MARATVDKRRAVEARLVIRRADGPQVDAALKALIEEWLVPALVDEYVRLRHVSAPPCGLRDEGSESKASELQG